MAKTPTKPVPQQSGQSNIPAQQQGSDAPTQPQQGAPIIRDWAAF